MSCILALGEADELEGFALAGAQVVLTTTATEIIDAWCELDPDVGLVILSAAAARVLGGRLAEKPDVLTAVLP
jgi:vacuolar-type H+-ATPase subunit F/Vma7